VGPRAGFKIRNGEKKGADKGYERRRHFIVAVFQI
jgi:hypothetical protein